MTLVSQTAVDLMDLDAYVAGTDGELFARLRDDEPCHWNDEPGDGRGFWSLTRYADVKAAALDWRTFSNTGGTQIQDRRAEGHGKPSIHNEDPPRHKQLRKLLVGDFARDNVQRMEPRAREVVAEHLDRVLEGEGDRCFVHGFSHHVPLLVFATMLGAPKEDAGLLLDWTNKVGGQEDPEFVPTPEVMAEARQELFDYFHELAEARRKDPQDDLISALVTAEVDGQPLDRGDLDPYFILLVVAGNETTRNLMSGSILALHDHPGEWGRLKAGEVSIPDAVEELLRYTSPVICMRRTATRDVELHGRTIRAGEKVVLWWNSANRDPRQFDEPDTLLLDRSPNKHLGFGWGSHFCLGSHLARLEAEVMLEELVKRDVDLVVGEPDRLRSNFFRGIKRLPVSVRA